MRKKIFTDISEVVCVLRMMVIPRSFNQRFHLAGDIAADALRDFFRLLF